MKELIANFYELWGGAYLGDFSNLMFNNQLYGTIAISSIFLAVIFPALYYYVIDKPSTAKISVWFLMILIGGVIAFLIAYVSSNNGLTEVFADIGEPVPRQFSSDMLIFGLVNAMLTMLLIILLSIPLKIKSTNSSYIPF